jgi:hypothetical protein
LAYQTEQGSPLLAPLGHLPVEHLLLTGQSAPQSNAISPSPGLMAQALHEASKSIKGTFPAAPVHLPVALNPTHWQLQTHPASALEGNIKKTKIEEIKITPRIKVFSSLFKLGFFSINLFM